MSSYTLHIKKSKWRQRWYLVLIAENGHKLMHSENYARHIDALTVAENIAIGGFIIIDNEPPIPR